MDVGTLLDRARTRAGLTRQELASLGGTSTSALSAYERGIRSPTVATLDRLLEACGLQLRPVLEPFLADLDAAAEALLRGPVRLPSCASLVEALEAEGVTWAFDGRTALALHGLGSDHLDGGRQVELVLAADAQTRQFLHPLGIHPVDGEGSPLWDNWIDVDLARVARASAWTRFGPISVRIAPAVPVPVRMSLEGRPVPVLALLDVEAAHPQLADVLARLRERRAGTVVP